MNIFLQPILFITFYYTFRSGQPIPIEYLPAEHTLDSRWDENDKFRLRKNFEIYFLGFDYS